MKKTLLLLLLTASSLLAGKLTVTQGIVHAHTEVFGDSSIDPKTTSITSHLTMSKGIESLKGSVVIGMTKLKSEKEGRDKNMFEALEIAKYTTSTFTFKKVEKTSKGYAISGILDFHGVKKPLTIYSDIKNDKKSLTIQGKASFLLSAYNIKPISMFFLTVRDQIDLKINVSFKKGS
jgi:polyisoprenoid-binding protein YceI